MNAGLALPDAVGVESAADIFVGEEEEVTPAPGSTDSDAIKPEAGESKPANAAAVNRSREVVDMRIAGSKIEL